MFCISKQLFEYSIFIRNVIAAIVVSVKDLNIIIARVQ